MNKLYIGQFSTFHEDGRIAFAWQGVSGNSKQRRLIVRRWKKHYGFIVRNCHGGVKVK